MGPGDAASKAKAPRFGCERLDMAGHRIVALIAMHVDHQTALFGNRAQRPNAGGAVRHRAFEVRNSAHNVDPLVESAFKVFRRAWESVITVLRKGDELQVDVRSNSTL